MPVPLLQKRDLQHGEFFLLSDSCCLSRHHKEWTLPPARGKTSGRRHYLGASRGSLSLGSLVNSIILPLKVRAEESHVVGIPFNISHKEHLRLCHPGLSILHPRGEDI